MPKFILSKKADDDIEELYGDGYRKFGKRQAIKYLEELNLMFFFFPKIQKLKKIGMKLK